MKVLVALAQAHVLAISHVVELEAHGAPHMETFMAFVDALPALQSLMGAINQAVDQAGGWPGPTPPPTTPLDRARARQKISQNNLWVNLQPDESGPVQAILGAAYNQYDQFYTVGGSGGMGVNEFANPASPSGWSFTKFVDGQGITVHDVNQAADAYVTEQCVDQGHVLPPGPANLNP